MAVVLLLPLVPVMQTTRSSGASCSHSPRPPAHRDTARLELPQVAAVPADPGDFTTTSQPASAARPPSAVASTGRPATPPAAAGRPPAPG